MSDSDEFTTGEPNPDETDALLSRLNLIDDQPLEARAAAFTQLHDELHATLEGGDAARHHG